jgi:hypothetical protein
MKCSALHSPHRFVCLANSRPCVALTDLSSSELLTLQLKTSEEFDGLLLLSLLRVVLENEKEG